MPQSKESTAAEARGASSILEEALLKPKLDEKCQIHFPTVPLLLVSMHGKSQPRQEKKQRHRLGTNSKTVFIYR